MKLFVSSLILLSVLAFLQLARSPPTCECLCGGQISCPANTTAYCECDNNKHCKGACLRRTGGPIKEAAGVLSIITAERITEANIREQRDRNVQILNQLFEGKVKTGLYRIEYKERTVGFGFAAETESDLRQARDELRK